MEDKKHFEDMPKPIGDFILSQKDILYMEFPDGAYFHYEDVCTLLKRYAASQPTSGQAVWVKATNPWREEDENSSISPAQSGNASQSLLRETIEDILLKTGKHNQEECSELADAVLRDIPGANKEYAVAFAEFCVRQCEYCFGGWKSLKNEKLFYTTSELYELFKKQSNK